mmetsp:Transcript_14288/g.31289  ORF Transcript_14288/g.31289 Transcript_14288/m.31289 type:complete len:98 (-) Transcript_14288:19-312(-)
MGRTRTNEKKLFLFSTEFSAFPTVDFIVFAETIDVSCDSIVSYECVICFGAAEARSEERKAEKPIAGSRKAETKFTFSGHQLLSEVTDFKKNCQRTF